MNLEGVEINWLGHASFKVENVYIDTFQIKEEEKAEIILITHSHYDHCSIGDINKMVKPGTIIVATPDCSSKFSKLEGVDLKLVKPGDVLELGDVKVEAVAAYNVNKNFHPKENEWVGYILTVKGKRIYHASDTDLIPEMNDLNVDIALLPIGGTYTMNAKEAAQAVSRIKTKIAVPMHYGSIVGKVEDAEEFKDLVKDAQVVLL